ncbi:hypothetical protein [Thalassococcus sp. S3]|uniref:hypothetical protein n=1 Tax=Thalassococcus sp. S3 TaxID=2017482 RepID=UPI00102479E5|nr:hypothetical protein [Thalassococcus sp. S3]QBF31520.1 hypothetical protein CFI11_09865 [Thalassococcus sp. S3]
MSKDHSLETEKMLVRGLADLGDDSGSADWAYSNAMLSVQLAVYRIYRLDGPMVCWRAISRLGHILRHAWATRQAQATITATKDKLH